MVYIVWNEFKFNQMVPTKRYGNIIFCTSKWTEVLTFILNTRYVMNQYECTYMRRPCDKSCNYHRLVTEHYSLVCLFTWQNKTNSLLSHR